MAMQNIIVKMSDADQAVAHRAYKDLEGAAMRAGSPGAEPLAVEMSKQLAETLDAKAEPVKKPSGKILPAEPLYSTEVRNKLCRVISYVGQASAVPALVEAMGDADVRDMARFALERIPGAEATDALVKALDEQVGQEFRVGVIGALAKNRGPKAEAALRKAAGEDPIPEVKMAAVHCLANYADPANGAVILKAASCPCKRTAAAAYQAAIRLAENLTKAGKKAEAADLFKKVAASDAPEAQKKAAEIGLKAAG